MTRYDVENETRKVFNDIYDRLSEAYDLLRDDDFTENDKIECEAILIKLMNDTRGE